MVPSVFAATQVRVPTPTKRLAIWRAQLGEGLPPLSDAARRGLAALNETCHGWTGSDVRAAAQQAAAQALCRWHRAGTAPPPGETMGPVVGRPVVGHPVVSKEDLGAAVRAHRPALLRGSGRAAPWTLVPPSHAASLLPSSHAETHTASQPNERRTAPHQCANLSAFAAILGSQFRGEASSLPF